jgi:hypothetical protein
MGKYRPRSAPNLPTIKKIRDAAEYREQNRDEWGRPPTWNSVSKQFHLSARTLQRHASELFVNWDDPKFHW